MFIWLASYPKSGNTWLRLWLNSLQTGGGPVDINAMPFRIPQASDRKLFDNALGVASSELTAAEIDMARPLAFALEAAASQKPLFRKVHDAWRHTLNGKELFPRSLTLASIYVVRDPRDVAVSFAHHSAISLDHVIDRMADNTFAFDSSGKRLTKQLPQVVSSWTQHVESWLDESRLSLLLVRYEDMLIDPVACCRAVCDRLGWSPGEAVIEAAVEQTRFQRIVSQEREAGFSERVAPDRVFFRQGKSGGWKDTLTAVQVHRIEKDHGPVMRRLGYL